MFLLNIFFVLSVLSGLSGLSVLSGLMNHLPSGHAQQSQQKQSRQKLGKLGPPVAVKVLAKNLGVVWGMVFINSQDILFTERHGDVKILNTHTGKVSLVPGAPAVFAKGQGGLLDVALHPRFKTNKTVYFSYAKAKGKKQTTAVARAILDRSYRGQGVSPLSKNERGKSIKKIRLHSVQDIFVARPYVSSNIHFGSRLVFDKKGFLYVTVGDRGKRHKAQQRDNHLGKILRLTAEGQPGRDNPFVSVRGMLPEVWSYGHRNPQGLFIHPHFGTLWGQEHGPRGGDEINLIKKGKNYGWPVITYGKEYWGPSIGEGFKKAGLEQPVKYWTPSIAPSGLLIYSGKKFKHWRGNFFSGSLVLRHLNRLEITGQKAGTEERLLSHLKWRVRNVIEGPKGHIYISVDKGKILKITLL